MTQRRIRTQAASAPDQATEAALSVRVVTPLLANLTQGVAVVTADGGVELANPAAIRLLGLGAEAAEPRLLPEPLRQALARTAIGSAFRVEAGDRLLDVTIDVIPRDEAVEMPAVESEGSVAGFRAAMPVAALREVAGAARGLRLVLTIQDVTDEDRLHRMKYEFISTASHELRTPLASIKGYIDTLLDDEEDLPAEVARLLSIIQRNTDRLAGIVDDLFDLSKIDAGRFDMQMGVVDAGTLVAAAVETMRPLAATKEQRFTVELPSEPVALWGDRLRLGQMLLNLLSNAHRFAPPGGEFGVRVTVHGEQLRLTVWDTGPGIRTADQARLFERFNRVVRPDAQETRGTVLGLAVTKAIVELHGGRITLQSEAGAGAQFHVYLPRYDA